jgi:hypothetical protein
MRWFRRRDHLGRQSRWVYLLPTIHLCACFVSFIGLVIPSLQYVGRLFTFVLVADLPISLPAYALAWKYGALGVAWIFVAGTFWWYLLGRAGVALLNRFRRRASTTAQQARKPGTLNDGSV